MKPVVLFRKTLVDEEEIKICEKYFKVIYNRSDVKKGDLVIPRYSALPFYKEFEYDINNLGAEIVNSYKEHCYVADLRNWYYDLGEYTPRTWFYMDQLPMEGPFVLKGQTNSKKHSWNTDMFATDRQEAFEVFTRLSADGYIGSQMIYAREYVPLRNFLKGIRGLPISEEYRFFVLDGKVMSGAFYWSEHTEYIVEELGYNPDPNNVPKGFLDKIISIVSPKIRFFVVDVAKTEKGDWIVIELNDGQQSGLSDNDPEKLYYNMSKILKM